MGRYPGIDRTRVSSSLIATLGYEPESGTLAVQFHNGHIYHYPDVTKDEYNELLAAGSLGKHFGQHIRGQKTCQRVTGECSACGDVGPVDDACTDCGAGSYQEGQ